MSYSLCCTFPPSTTASAPHCCLSVHDPLVFLLSIAWIGSSQTSSFNSSHSNLAAHIFQWTIQACFRSFFFTSSGQTTLILTFTAT